jgi:FkbM family methyltransferase
MELLLRGSYEPDMAAAFDELLYPGGVCVDVGANEGYFSILASARVGPSGRVLAVEPQERLGPVIRENIRLNRASNIVLEPVAVSDRPGDGELFLAPDTNTGATGFTPSQRYRVPTQRVRTLTLAALLERHEIWHIDLLKLDIEGFEYEAILGSKEVFRAHRVKHLALEFHPRILEQRGRPVDHLTDFLLDCGYQRNKLGDVGPIFSLPQATPTTAALHASGRGGPS